MSEYQYYELQAIDRPLSKEQMAELRAISSRAEITPTRFTNFYSYGSFKGNEIELLERYFDAHVYIANWGSHVLIFGIPSKAVDLKALQAYQAECGFAVRQRVPLSASACRRKPPRRSVLAAPRKSPGRAMPI